MRAADSWRNSVYDVFLGLSLGGIRDLVQMGVNIRHARFALSDSRSISSLVMVREALGLDIVWSTEQQSAAWILSMALIPSVL